MVQPVAKIILRFNNKSTMVDPMTIHGVFVKVTGSTPTPAEWNALGSNYAKAFTTVHGSGRMDMYLPNSIDAGSNKCDYIVYDLTGHLDGTPTSGPVAQGTFTVAPITVDNLLPEGCSCAVSYRADYGTDPEFVRDPVTHKVTARPRAHKRNRIYVPINGSALQAGPNGEATVGAPFVSAASGWMNALTTLSDVLTGTGNSWKWQVWSKARGLIYDVILGWIDNRVDYQRRRSDPGTTKALVPISESFFGLDEGTLSPSTPLVW